jgi:hypothetical protein
LRKNFDAAPLGTERERVAGGGKGLRLAPLRKDRQPSPHRRPAHSCTGQGRPAASGSSCGLTGPARTSARPAICFRQTALNFHPMAAAWHCLNR